MLPIVDRKRDSRRRASSALLLKTEKMTEEEVIVAEAIFLKSLIPTPRYRQYLARAVSHMALGDFLSWRKVLLAITDPAVLRGEFTCSTSHMWLWRLGGAKQFSASV
ncbi:unnamed protein product [Porites lobata]|uniref:Uncharacterized protein n=1 Tax=Porites lobata TaxID=104759 RepID=A0ABN8P178_9CNID|nr:unnamed protein product [Porites lobata]